jgi:hypothetical protein
MSTASNGAARERRVRDFLIVHGWECICRSAGSKGPADLVMAHSRHGVALVQVGPAGKAISPADRERLLHAAELCSALPLIATPLSVGYRLRLVTLTPAQSWLDFDPDVGLLDFGGRS